jgi:hypothetical protein
MFNVVWLIGSAAILFFIVKYRVHVHITYTPSGSRRPTARKSGRRAEARADLGPTAKTRPVLFSQTPESIVWGDIASALVNLGASKQQARSAARQALAEHPDASFDIQMTVALQKVGKAA